ncbi:MAG: hypothetical protein H7343_18780 [Undibacterium sp.]|nr:hypothetical protein [Opitutaceae bacterium]
MYDLTLTKLRACVAVEQRSVALQLVRVAAEAGLIQPRDAVELMLVLSDGTPRLMVEAIDAMRLGVPGSYRYVPAADYAAA